MAWADYPYCPELRRGRVGLAHPWRAFRGVIVGSVPPLRRGPGSRMGETADRSLDDCRTVSRRGANRLEVAEAKLEGESKAEGHMRRWTMTGAGSCTETSSD